MLKFIKFYKTLYPFTKNHFFKVNIVSYPIVAS